MLNYQVKLLLLAVLFCWSHPIWANLLKQANQSHLSVLNSNTINQHVQLSPSQNKLAMVYRKANQISLYVFDITDQKLSHVELPLKQVNQLKWANDQQLVIEYINQKHEQQIGIIKCSESSKCEMESVSETGFEARDSSMAAPAISSRLVSTNSQSIWFTQNVRNDMRYDLYRLDLKSLKIVASILNRIDVNQWLIAPDGNQAIAVTIKNGLKNLDLIDLKANTRRDPPTINIPVTPARKYWLVDKSNHLWFSDYTDKGFQVFSYSLSNQQLNSKQSFSDNAITALVLSHGNDTVVGVQTTEDSEAQLLFDSKAQSSLAQIEIQFARLKLSLLAYSPKHQTFYFQANEVNNGSVYQYSLSNKKMTLLLDRTTKQPKNISQYSMSIASIDGSESLHAYFTGFEIEKKQPLVIWVNHSPFEYRNTQTFNPTANQLARKGIQTLRLDPRGQLDYEIEYWQASQKQWPESAVKDLKAAIQWALQQQIADKSSICLMGEDWGAYAIMLLLAQEPNIANCVFAVNPIMELTSNQAGLHPAFSLIHKDLWLTNLDTISQAKWSPTTFLAQLPTHLTVLATHESLLTMLNAASNKSERFAMTVLSTAILKTKEQKHSSNPTADAVVQLILEKLHNDLK